LDFYLVSYQIVSPLIFDFSKLEATFELEGEKLTLTGSLEIGECKMITGKKLQEDVSAKWDSSGSDVFHTCR